MRLTFFKTRVERLKRAHRTRAGSDAAIPRQYGSRDLVEEGLFAPVSERVRPSGSWMPRNRIRALGVVTVVMLGVLGVRSAFLQTKDSGAYRTAAEGNRLRLLVEYAARGVMFDRFGVQLVQNIPSTNLVAYPDQLPQDIAGVILVLQEVFPDIPGGDFSERLMRVDASSVLPVPVVFDITHEQHVAVLARSDRLPGIGAESRAEREYGYESMLAHVLGYTGRLTKEEHEKHPNYLLTESIGKSGIEYSYERELKGVNGARKVEVDASGNVQKDLGTIPARPGANLKLHLDVGLQQRLTEELVRQLQETGGEHAAAVALDPRSGGVRALVSIPSYDHTALAQGLTPVEAAQILSRADEPLLNRAVQGQYPPGSVFKIAVAAGALEEGVITERTVVDSSGGIRVGQWFFPDWKPGGHGRTDVIKALAESVNTFFYLAGGGMNEARGLGIARLVAWAKRLGFGDVTGINLPGETAGFLPSPEWKQTAKGEQWYIGDTYHAAIGQGDILVTPLQLAVATSVIANGGTRYAPQLVEAFVRSDGSVIATQRPEKRDARVLRAATAALVRRGMREAVVAGSAQALADLPVTVAGKTGTAQTGSTDVTHAWFTSFSPYENPDLVLTILVEEGGAGDRVAVPVARNVLRWYYSERQRGAP